MINLNKLKYIELDFFIYNCLQLEFRSNLSLILTKRKKKRKIKIFTEICP